MFFLDRIREDKKIRIILKSQEVWKFDEPVPVTREYLPNKFCDWKIVNKHILWRNKAKNMIFDES